MNRSWVFPALVAVAAPISAQDFYFISSRDSAAGELNYEIYRYLNGVETRLSTSDRIEEHPVLSTVNNKIYFASKTNEGVSEIFSMDPGGGNVERVTTDGGEPPFTGNSHPFLAPDELSIFVTTHKEDDTSILRRVGLDGSPMGTIIDASAELGHSPVVDVFMVGEKLYYASEEDGDYEIYRADLDGSNKEQLTSNSLYDSGANPNADGSLIAFTQEDAVNPCKTHIWVMDDDGANKVQVTSSSDDGFKWSFGWDGTDILYVSNENGDEEVFSIGSNGTGKTLLISSSGRDQHLQADRNCGNFSPEIHVEATPLSGPPGTTVDFTASGSPTFVAYEWTFGDGATASTATPNTSHTYSQAGLFQVSVTGRDNCTPPNRTSIDLPTVLITRNKVDWKPFEPWVSGATGGFSRSTFGEAPSRGRSQPILALERLTLDLATGRATRLKPSVGSEAESVAGTSRATASCFLNTKTMGFFSRGTTDTEWRDWSLKNTGKTGLITSFYLGYATMSNDPSHPSSPGPGASIEVAFFSGETGFCKSVGVELANSRFCFTGLPGVMGTCASNTAAGFLVTAFVPSAQLFCAPDGKLGVGFGFKDNDGAGLSLTGPLMTSFVSENTCAEDAFDLYNRRPSSTGTCLGSFFFGGCEPLPQPDLGCPCATFYIGLGEDDGTDLASSSSWNPTGCNEDDYVALSDPVIGGTWEVGVDNTSSGSDPNHDRVGVVLSLVSDGMTGNVCFSGGFKGVFNGTALYARPPYLPGATAQSFFLEGTGMSPAPANFRSFSTPVGKELDLVGARFCTQGYSLDFPSPLSNRLLSNAIVIEVGTSL